MLKTLLAMLVLFVTVSICHGQTAKEWADSGSAKLKLKDYDGAEADYSKAIELEPMHVSGYYGRGYAKGKLKDYAGAIADYNKAIELDPKDAKAYYERGVAKLRLRQKDSGCLDLSKAGELGYDGAYDAIKEYCR